MSIEALIGVLGILVTLLLVVVGLLNFSVFRKQLNLAQQQIDTAVRQLELAQKQPDLYLIPRAITEAQDHIRLFVERPKLRPYFYDSAEWVPGDETSADEIKAMAELVLNNFASSLMHAAAFPAYPVRGVDRTIKYHLRHSPALREFLFENFERFPFSGLTLLCLQGETRPEVESMLRRLAEVDGVDESELERRRELLRLFLSSEAWEPIEFTAYSMKRRR